MRIWIVGAVLALASVVVLAQVQAPARIVVHEWGTFTSVSGADGKPMVWQPLSGPTDLPSFVYGSRRADAPPEFDKSEFMTTLRLETPVLYFYSDRDATVSAKVTFPRGKITEYYPQAKRTAGGIDWTQVEVRPGGPAAFPREARESHYYPARETDAAPLEIRAKDGIQHEKFLFYRGVGWFDLPVRVTLQESRVTVENRGGDPLPQAILFENRGGARGFRVLGPVAGSMTVIRPELSPGNADPASELEQALEAAGLYAKEARAMMKTWQGSWFEEGLRLIYLLPRSTCDPALPLALEPAPAELARVFVGRAEIIAPEIEVQALEVLRRAGPDLAQARTGLAPFGRFTGPVLQRTARLNQDPEFQERISRLLEDSGRKIPAGRQ